MRRAAFVLGLLACGAPAPPAPPKPSPVPTPPTPALALADGATCAPAPRAALDACLAEHAFCARDVTDLDHGRPDLVVVATTGAIDCAGYYVLAASGGVWAAIEMLHMRRHHDPQYGDLAVERIHDETVAGQRVTRIAYTIETVLTEDADPELAHLVMSCTWPRGGWPRCGVAETQ